MIFQFKAFVLIRDIKNEAKIFETVECAMQPPMDVEEAALETWRAHFDFETPRPNFVNGTLRCFCQDKSPWYELRGEGGV